MSLREIKHSSGQLTVPPRHLLNLPFLPQRRVNWILCVCTHHFAGNWDLFVCVVFFREHTRAGMKGAECPDVN